LPGLIERSAFFVGGRLCFGTAYLWGMFVGVVQYKNRTGSGFCCGKTINFKATFWPMAGFRLKLNVLRNIPYASSIRATLPFDPSFEMEYMYRGTWNLAMVKPILVHSIVIFLVHFPDGELDSMALVYNSRDEWSDIEKESTGQTAAIGLAIEKYYSSRYLFSAGSHLMN
jgi:hypothetical protein